MKNFPSPCISICKLNNLSGLCDGCFRTKDEIAKWPSMTDNERWSLVEKLRERQGTRRRVSRRRKRN